MSPAWSAFSHRFPAFISPGASMDWSVQSEHFSFNRTVIPAIPSAFIGSKCHSKNKTPNIPSATKATNNMLFKIPQNEMQSPFSFFSVILVINFGECGSLLIFFTFCPPLVLSSSIICLKLKQSICTGEVLLFFTILLLTSCLILPSDP